MSYNMSKIKTGLKDEIKRLKDENVVTEKRIEWLTKDIRQKIRERQLLKDEIIKNNARIVHLHELIRGARNG